MKIDKEFKEALSHLPDKEKDKLIIRLLKKDIALANRLHFELLGDATTDELAEKLKERIYNYIVSFRKQMVDEYGIFKAGWITMEIRDMSGMINEFKNTTRDKFNTVAATSYMIDQCLKTFGKGLNNQFIVSHKRCMIYIVSKIFNLVVDIKKMDTDYWLDLEETFQSIGKQIVSFDNFMKLAIYHGFDVNWILDFEKIPEDIEIKLRSLRKKGYLKYRTKYS